MTWDLREQVLVAKWVSEGHEVRTMDSQRGVAICLRCSTIIAVSQRAKVLADGGHWSGGADKVRPCNPNYLTKARMR